MATTAVGKEGYAESLLAAGEVQVLGPSGHCLRGVPLIYRVIRVYILAHTYVRMCIFEDIRFSRFNFVFKRF